MLKEESVGIIPLKKKGHLIEVLLVKHARGHWAFPKGHPEKGETLQETASRELKEEVNLKIVSYFEKEPILEKYSFFREEKKVNKSVYYFMAWVEGELKIDNYEIVDAEWFTLKEAYHRATFPECKNIIKSHLLTL